MSTETQRRFGYLAFPTGLPSSSLHSNDNINLGSVPPTTKAQSNHASSSGSKPSNAAGHEDQKWKDNEARRRKRIELEREAARLSEIEWVRSGGVLRDAHGIRDDVRTNRIRTEIREEQKRVEEERRVMAEWEGYEKRWMELLGGKDPVRFGDIPWPISSGPSTRVVSAADLTSDAIEGFLFASLSVRRKVTSPVVTRRERVRASILRWHPDKLAGSGVLARIAEEDAGIVREGIGIVMTILMGLQEKEKAAAAT